MDDDFLKNLKKMHLEKNAEKPINIPKNTGISIGKSQIESIRGAIDEINAQIENREELKAMMLSRFDAIKMEINNQINKISADIDVQQQIILFNSLIDIEKLKQMEELNAWRDIAQLKKELREHLKEVRELELKSEELESLLQ